MKANEIFGEDGLLNETANSIANGDWSATSIFNRLSYIYQLGHKHGIEKCRKSIVDAFSESHNNVIS